MGHDNLLVHLRPIDALCVLSLASALLTSPTVEAGAPTVLLEAGASSFALDWSATRRSPGWRRTRAM
jgi:hypothetical protein